MSAHVSIEGLDKAAVLAALYNASRPLGMGFMHYDASPMTTEEAREILSESQRFDYLKGRVMKIDLSADDVDPWGYDRDNGQGAAERVVEELRATDDAASTNIRAAHAVGTAQAAQEAREELSTPHRMSVQQGIPVIEMGLADVAEHLGPAIDRAVGPGAEGQAAE